MHLVWFCLSGDVSLDKASNYPNSTENSGGSISEHPKLFPEGENIGWKVDGEDGQWLIENGPPDKL